MRETFTKRWSENDGFTEQEAISKVRKVNEAYAVGSANSKWKPATFVPDPKKQHGFMVVIETK